VQTGKTHQKLTRLKTFMRFTLKKSKFIQNIAFGSAAIGVLAGVGLAGAPAQAGTFTLGGSNGTTLCNNTDTPCIRDTEWGAGGPEPIWSTFAPTPNNPPGVHGISGINGWDNPTISFVSDPGFSGARVKVEYFGSGTATKTNDFLWNNKSLLGTNKALTNTPNNWQAASSASKEVTVFDGKLPFAFTTLDGSTTTIANGTNYTGTQDVPHYFATIDGTWDTPEEGEVLYLGLSDRFGANDDDSADYTVKLTVVEQFKSVPEPSSLLGLLAVGGLGAALKRKKQEG
jgi:PEP-CTERM motif